MSEEKLIDRDAVEDLFIQFVNGAVLDGKRITDVLNPYDYCVNIVNSWKEQL
jgi:hypothetical protein